jgi:hypothetical protein
MPVPDRQSFIDLTVLGRDKGAEVEFFDDHKPLEQTDKQRAEQGKRIAQFADARKQIEELEHELGKTCGLGEPETKAGRYEIIIDGHNTGVTFVEETGKWSAGSSPTAKRVENRGLFWTGAKNLKEALAWVDRANNSDEIV